MYIMSLRSFYCSISKKDDKPLILHGEFFFSQLFGILLDLVLPPLQEERLESFWGNQNMLVSDSYKALLSAYHVTLFEIDFKIKWKIGIQYTDML